MIDPELDRALAALIEQWNIAENRIKRAEHVRANEIVAPAIFELRYAGRKIVDSIEIILTHNLASDAEKHSRVSSYIADATEDCVKAKHDAIDAMMNFVTTWFDDTEKKVGLDEIQKLFPDYLTTLSRISEVQGQIAESRRDRNKLRDAIYNRIDGDDYDSILNLYLTMKNSQERVTALVAKNKKKTKKENNLKYAGLVLGLAGWTGFMGAQYRASAFPFDKALWASLLPSTQAQPATPPNVRPAKNK
jgi:hypothetical protein